MNTKDKLSLILSEVKKNGLHDDDIANITDLINAYEFGLALDVLLTQLYELDIKLSKQYEPIVSELISKMKLDYDDYEWYKSIFIK